MKYPNTIKLITILLLTLLSMIIVSCGSTKPSTSGDLDLVELGSFSIDKTGATLWGENCNRCHLAPDPVAFSDAQWEAIGTHMRIRAGLTAEDSRKIIEFLQQSN